MKGDELNRINNNNNAEYPRGPKIIIFADNIKNPKKVMEDTKNIMKVISQFAYTNNWPSDNEWKKILPKWFVESMTSKSSTDRDKDENLYHFESWTANLKDRCWLWYSSKTNEKSLTIVLEAVSLPYLYSTFIYILYSQGISIDNIMVKDDIYD